MGVIEKKYYTVSQHPDPHMDNFVVIKKYRNKKQVSRHLIIVKDLVEWRKMIEKEGYEEKM